MANLQPKDPGALSTYQHRMHIAHPLLFLWLAFQSITAIIWFQMNKHLTLIKVSSPVERNSGSMFAKVPSAVFLELRSWGKRWQIPKSLSLLTKLASRRILAGVKSLCIMPIGLKEWRKMSTWHNPVAMLIWVFHDNWAILSLHLSWSRRLPLGRYS